MAGWHHRLDGCEPEWTLGVGDGQRVLACCDSWGRKELDSTEWLNWTDKQDLSRKSPEPNKRISRKSFLQEVTTMVYFPETLTTQSIFFLSLNKNSLLINSNLFSKMFFACHVNSNTVLWSWVIETRAGLWNILNNMFFGCCCCFLILKILMFFIKETDSFQRSILYNISCHPNTLKNWTEIVLKALEAFSFLLFFLVEIWSLVSRTNIHWKSNIFIMEEWKKWLFY